jgi:prepilin peptidase CpaA
LAYIAVQFVSRFLVTGFSSWALAEASRQVTTSKAMNIFNPSLWALWWACLLLVMAAVINDRSLTVPNRLSLAAIVAGWLMATAISAHVAIPSRGGGVMPSLAATAVGFFLLVPFYQRGWLGAGCVKMQMAFGAWVGCAVDLPAALLVTGLATVAGALLTAIGASIVAVRLRSDSEAGAWTYLFPAQVTLSLGSVFGVLAAGPMGWI